jgi:hypothetical protein
VLRAMVGRVRAAIWTGVEVEAMRGNEKGGGGLLSGSKKYCKYDKPGKEEKAGGRGENLAMNQERSSLLNMNPSANERNMECVNISWGGGV